MPAIYQVRYIGYSWLNPNKFLESLTNSQLLLAIHGPSEIRDNSFEHFQNFGKEFPNKEIRTYFLTSS